MNYIMHGTASEKEEILALYKSQLGREVLSLDRILSYGKRN